MCGYVSFKVTGGYPEKFVNSVTKDNINLWDLKKLNGNFYAKILAPEYKSLRRKARRAGAKIKITEKHGCPIFVTKYRKRIGLIVGAILFFIIMNSFSLFIWRINIIGNKDLPSSDILAVMKEFGVHTGSKKSDINPSMLKESLMAKLTDISWMSVNVSGSCLNITIKERVKSPEIVEEGEPCDIVADVEGQVERMEVYKGTACVKEGDAVTKGQVLISGIIEEAEGNSSLLAAEGKIFAKTKRKMTESVKLNQLNAVDTGKLALKYKLEGFGKNIPLNPWCKPGDECRKEEENQIINILGLQLPFVFHKEIYYYQECEEKSLSIEEARGILEQNILERQKNEFPNVKIISTNIENYEKDNEYIADATIVCIENIAKKQKISFN